MNYLLQRQTFRRRSAFFSLFAALVLTSALGGLTACGSSTGEEGIEQKRKQLADLKSKAHDLQTQIADLENEIASLENGDGEYRIPVTLFTVVPRKYKNPIELQGLVESDRNVIVSAEASGVVTQVHVKEGQAASPGQLIATLDASVLQNNMAELKTALDLATVNYEKQKKLWTEMKIGSEMQYLEAENRKNALERQIATLQSQLSKYTVRAPIGGMVDRVFINAGESVAPGMQIARVVDGSNVKVTADVSEKYVGKLRKGDSVLVRFPAIGETTEGIIRAVGQVIDVNNRTFIITVELRNKPGHYKPNLLAMITAYDFQMDSALVVPSRLVNVVNDTSFIYAAEVNGKDTVARRLAVGTRILDNRNILVSSGLHGGQWLIDDGYRSVSDGDNLRVIEIR